jgi:hypothetical protein
MGMLRDLRALRIFFVVVGFYIQHGRNRTPEHHPRGKGGGEPPRLITEAIRIAFVVHAVEAVG